MRRLSFWVLCGVRLTTAYLYRSRAIADSGDSDPKGEGQPGRRVSCLAARLLQKLIEVGNQHRANVRELLWLELPPRSADGFSERIDEIGGGQERA